MSTSISDYSGVQFGIQRDFRDRFLKLPGFIKVIDIIDIKLSIDISTMANLIARNIDDKVVQALKRRAAHHKQSMEAEHRAILEQAVLKTRHRSLAEVLASMPDTGQDEDFERKEDKGYQANGPFL